MSNDNIKNPDTDHILDPKTVVSSSDFTGLLQAMPKEGYVVGQLSDVHSLPEQGGLEELESGSDAKVN